uniref:Uncharacterized protein n=1 Tax=Leersia perrieri TaxID=77586 RepID=A0A0D9VU29_9ORYZ
MADDCFTQMPELDDVHRWLPSDVLSDIGITDTAEHRRLGVVDELAVRLIDVLGGRMPSGEKATSQCLPSSFHCPAKEIRDHHALADAGRPRAAAAPPPYLPAPAAPWQVMTYGPMNTMHLPRAFGMHQPRQMAPPAAACRSGGTGFFLPRNSTAKVAATVPPRHANHVARQRQCRAQRHGRRCYRAAAATAGR